MFHLDVSIRVNDLKFRWYIRFGVYRIFFVFHKFVDIQFGEGILNS